MTSSTGFNTSVVLLLFGQLLAQIISGLSNEFIPASGLLSGISLIISVLLILNRKNLIWPSLGQYDLLYFLFLFGLFLSAYNLGQGSSTNQKIIGTLYNIILPGFIVFLFSFTIKTVDIYKLGLFARRIAIVSIPLAFILFFLGFTHSAENSTKVSVVGVSNTIWFGRYLGLLIVVLVITHIRKNSFLNFFLIIAAIFLMLASGARGPFVAMFIAIFFAKFNIKPKYLLLVLLCTLLLPYLIELTTVADYLLSKQDFSNFNRINLITSSFELIKENLYFGIGYGNFGSYSKAFDDSILFYPHNILVEVLVENGIFLFILFIFMIIRTFYLGKNNPFLSTVFIYTFINSLFSGDINGNAVLFVSIFLIRLLADKKLINTNNFVFIKNHMVNIRSR